MRLDEKLAAFATWGYAPNDEQMKIHASTNGVVLVAGGERAGKSKVTGEEVAAHAVAGAKLVWIIPPDYEQGHAEFDYAMEELLKIGALLPDSVSRPKTGSWSMKLLSGCTIETKTGQDAITLASKAPDFIAMVEAAQQTWDNFQKLFNRTAEARTKGFGEMFVSGTFESSLGWYAEKWTEFQGPNTYGARSFSLPTWSNTTVFRGGRQDPVILSIEAGNPPDLFMERFGGVPTPPRGLVFREFRHTTHITPIRFGRTETPIRDQDGWILPDNTELEIWADPGYAGAYAVLFVAIAGSMVFHVDEVYAKGKVGEQVIAEAMGKRDLFQRVKRGVIDIAGRQHNAMESQVELWQRLAHLSMASEPVAIADGIARHRTFLSDPRTMAPRMYHDPKCVGTIREYGLYRYPEGTEQRAETELPIDRDNHSMKAIAYGLYHRFGYVDRLDKPKPRNLIAERSDYSDAPRDTDGARRAWMRSKTTREADLDR